MIRFVLARLTPYLSFSKFTLLHVIAIFLLTYAASRITNMNVQGGELPLGEMFTFPAVWRTGAFLCKWLFYIPAFFTVQLVCAEFELKLVRAQVINGMERSSIIAGWVIQNGLLTLIGGMAYLVTISLLGHSPASALDGALAEAASAMIGFLLYGFFFLNIAVLSAVFMRRPVPALALLLLWPLMLEPMIGFALNQYGSEGMNAYLPFAALSTLAPMPGSSPGFDVAAPTTMLSIGYGVVAICGAWWRLALLDL